MAVAVAHEVVQAGVERDDAPAVNRVEQGCQLPQLVATHLSRLVAGDIRLDMEDDPLGLIMSIDDEAQALWDGKTFQAEQRPMLALPGPTRIATSCEP